MAKFVDENGKLQNVSLEGMKYHAIAKREGLTFRQVINREFPTRAGDPDAFTQMCLGAGLRFKYDSKLGKVPTNLQSVLRPEAGTNQIGGTYTSAPQVPDSTILFVPALLETVEASLAKKTAPAVQAFEGLLAKERTIPGKDFKRAIVNFAGDKGPEDFEWKRTAQNSEPSIMLSITASDVSRSIPTYSMGMQVSAEAMLISGVDMIADPLERFFSLATFNDWIDNLLLLLNGDPDGVVSDMDDNTAALSQTKANVYDPSISAAGVLTQKAWLKWLYNGSMHATKNKVICDFDSALAIDERENRPKVTDNNSMDRLDVPFKIVYPAFQDTLEVIVMPEDSWPANTILGVDSNWAIEKVNSLFANYTALQEMILSRSTMVRVDHGSVMYRLYTEAFDVLSLTV
jgi:hypothetical protein